MNDREEAALGRQFSRDLAELQQGKCGMCGERDGTILDHDHQSGLIRGLLCRGCNTMEGQHGRCRDLDSCPVCLWRRTPAVAWLGYTVRFEGWYHGEDEFRDGPYASASDRAQLFAARQEHDLQLVREAQQKAYAASKGGAA